MTDTATILATAMYDVFVKMGQEATYNPAVGDAVSCYVHVEDDIELQPGGYEAEVYAHGTTLECLNSEVTTEPNPGDTFTVGDTTYTVQSVLSNNGYFIRLQVI